jgi:di/tricarboxylate transporter
MKKIWMPVAIAAAVLATSGCMSHNVSQPNAPIAGTVTADLESEN